MRLANLLFDGDDSYVIDFDDCGYGWFLYDLATALTFLEDRPDVGTLIAAWLRGYERLRPVSAADLAVIPALVMLRRLLVVAWIASHAETGIARSEGVQHTRTTCELAEGYLGGSLHGIQDKED
jgi:Ser/Thr protein kinase RdoA (MazF antagonist)